MRNFSGARSSWADTLDGGFLMRKYFDRWTLVGGATVFLIWLAAVPSSTLAGIIQVSYAKGVF